MSDIETRLRDAEATIAKIGLCDPAPHEARQRYEAKYGPVDALEHVTVKPASQYDADLIADSAERFKQGFENKP